MSNLRTGRRRYYDIFSHVYDRFIQLHARRDEGSTRNFLVDMADLQGISNPYILDICCGTGAVIEACALRYPEGLSLGYDFSHGMLSRVRERTDAQGVVLVEGDAATLPFADESFDLVTCSHALYELKGQARHAALQEMKRVIRLAGSVLIMEHEVPQDYIRKFFFNLRMMTMGSGDAREFVTSGLNPFMKVFPYVSLAHSPSGKSKLVTCRKEPLRQ